MNDEHDEIAAHLVSLINDFINRYTEILNIKKFVGNEQLFVNIAMSPATMIASTIIDKLSTTFGIDQKELIAGFNHGLVHGIEMSKEAHKKRLESN